MVLAYATVNDYQLITGDTTSSDPRVEMFLKRASVELRAECGLDGTETLTEDQAELAKDIVCDAASHALKPPKLGGMGEIAGATQASFSANGFTGNYTLSNASGSAWLDKKMVARLKRLLGKAPRIGTIMPQIGGW